LTNALLLSASISFLSTSGGGCAHRPPPPLCPATDGDAHIGIRPAGIEDAEGGAAGNMGGAGSCSTGFNALDFTDAATDVALDLFLMMVSPSAVTIFLGQRLSLVCLMSPLR
jgi:hypothetical protein